MKILNENGKPSIVIPRNEIALSYVEKMLLNANIQGVIPMNIQIFNECENYSFNIESKQSLSSVFAEVNMTFQEILSLFNSIDNIKNELLNYLISIDYLALSPDLIFYDITKENLFFCIIPTGNYLLDGSKELAEFLINNVDTSDESATQLAYEFYNNVCLNCIDFSMLIKKYQNTISYSETQIIDFSNMEPVGYELQAKDDETYYFVDPDSFSKQENNKLLFLPLIICTSIILLSGFIYAFLFLNKGMLEFLGISQENYIVIGAGISCLLSIIIYFIIRLFLLKEEKIEIMEREKEELLLQQRMDPGKMELFEYEMKNKKNN